ncbi:TIMELESS-interacting protein [Trichoplax sp. H2]|uniref:TIMELESS-interacting protein n=1 Tax=Trichoplax adhaerens TaxID=10228 RepID=B3RKP6_TRIAD|nr:hypothetical protein TRIADDRAFT_51712 [Trichoplax adhaerens]EDV29418.1 hypothetical protein TRIADDRAFT_51712 [Trichoplax adhaerens]RDD44691.1 TIMELESS-interacting protein [Trichoplax sp. H2]|eukprot:XP_002108620.1 hypothetical protein TRIADDRAFT_51712 [Trichoplax adhaerens]
MNEQPMPINDEETLFDGNIPSTANGLQDEKEIQAIENGLKRKVIRQPRPKLDSDRLTSERGLRALHQQFNKLHFKKKKDYHNNLITILRIYEHWAHRLYPKLPFVDVVHKVENLGSKKAVQYALSLIRLGQNDHYFQQDIDDNDNGDFNNDVQEYQQDTSTRKLSETNDLELTLSDDTNNKENEYSNKS